MSSAQHGQGARALRGALVYFTGDPFLATVRDCMVYEPDGMVVMHDGKILDVGPSAKVSRRLAADVSVTHYADCLIAPGFIDTHVHYVQTQIIGAFGRQLLDWLNDYAFPAELDFADKPHADKIAGVFCDELLRNGTTTALVFCAVYPQSVDALFEQAEARNLRLIAGKVLMDRNAPAALLDTPQAAYDDSKALLDKWHGRSRNLYAITPRFAPCCSNAELDAAGTLRKEHPGVFVHSHVSESPQEIDFVRELFPERSGYLDVYDHHGLLGRRAVYAHGVHLSEEEFQRCHETGTALAHCPTSNLFLGSGLFKVDQAKDPARPVHVGVGTDVGGGTSLSLLRTLDEAYKVAQLNGYPLEAVKAFYLATLGGAQALDLDDKIGSLQPGSEADLVVLDLQSTPAIRHRMERVESIEETLFVLMTMGDDRAIKATYVSGELAHTRDKD